MATTEINQKTFLETGKNNNFPFLKEKFLAGKFYAKDAERSGLKQFTEPMFLTFRGYVKILEDMFPSCWNIEASVDSFGKIVFKGFSIHFPTLQIKNSHGETLDLKDLYVYFPMYIRDNSSFYIGSLRGMRSTVTEAENYAQYFHSHIREGRLQSYGDITNNPNNNTSNYNEFCEGSGVIRNSREDFNNSNSNSKFEGLMVQTVRVATWESLEGTPYKKIHTVKSAMRSMGNSSGNLSSSENGELTLSTTLNEQNLVKFSTSLLKNYSIINPEFYVKFEEVQYANGLKGLEIQNENELLNALTLSYKDIVSKASNENDNIVIAATSEGAQGIPLKHYSYMFSYEEPREGRKAAKKGIVSRLLFVPERVQGEEPQATGRPLGSQGIAYFRGRLVKGTVTTNNAMPIESERRINLESVQNLQIVDKYKSIILNSIKKKLIQNAENVRNAG